MKTVNCDGVTLHFKTNVPCNHDMKEIVNLLRFREAYKKQINKDIAINAPKAKI